MQLALSALFANSARPLLTTVSRALLATNPVNKGIFNRRWYDNSIISDLVPSLPPLPPTSRRKPTLRNLHSLSLVCVNHSISSLTTIAHCCNKHCTPSYPVRPHCTKQAYSHAILFELSDTAGSITILQLRTRPSEHRLKRGRYQRLPWCSLWWERGTTMMVFLSTSPRSH